MIKEAYVTKLTKDYLLVDSIKEMNRIKNITKVILNYNEI